jgi:hypothetical protein
VLVSVGAPLKNESAAPDVPKKMAGHLSRPPDNPRGRTTLRAFAHQRRRTAPPKLFRASVMECGGKRSAEWKIGDGRWEMEARASMFHLRSSIFHLLAQRSKAPSPLRSAGALHNLIVSVERSA